MTHKHTSDIPGLPSHGRGRCDGAALQRSVRQPCLAALMPFFVFIAFAVCSVPGGLLAARIGKKKLMLLGLALNTVAVAVPAFINPPFPLLLACILLLGVGTTFLQVAGNPIMRDVSPPGAFSRNLALAQGIKGIGSTTMTILATAGISLAFLPVLAENGMARSVPHLLRADGAGVCLGVRAQGAGNQSRRASQCGKLSGSFG